MKTFQLLLITLAVVVPAFAVETKTWIQDEQADFEKGKLTNLSLRSDGRLTLAPSFREVLDSSTPYLWALAEDSKGNVYAGGGGPGGSAARVFRIAPDGTARKLAELDGLEVHALAVDRNDHLFAATSPDGKIYRVDRDGKTQLFFDPKAKYIWAMAFDSKGNLFVATGDQGVICRVAPDGKGGAFFATEESHARSMTIDSHDNLIVGTEPGGLVLRISPAGEGFVLYQAPKREITAVAIGPDGAIYAAGVGNRHHAGPSLPSVPLAAISSPIGGTSASVAAGQGQQVTPIPSPIPSLASSAPSIAGGSEVYRIDAESFPLKIWSNSQDIAYAIGFDSNGRPLIGTGNKGNIYRLDTDILSSLLLNAPPTQVTTFLNGRRGKIYAATGNIGKVYQIGPGFEKEGSIESDVLDAGFFSYWGRLSYRGDATGGSVQFASRSGNLDRPQKNWSPWAPVPISDAGGRVSSPPSRFLQWRAVLTGNGSGASTAIEDVEVAYLSRNVAPVIGTIEITPPNYRFPANQGLSLTASHDITLPPLGQHKVSASGLTLTAAFSVPMQYAKGYTGARWYASDDNGDDLSYKVEIRGVKETEWKPLRAHLREKHLSWDSTTFPDGEYVLRVTASDAPSNPPQEALSSHLVSNPFFIDNTAPQIIGLAAAANGNRVTVRWKAKDALSDIDKAEYSVNGGAWLMVLPTTKISDAPELDYVLDIERATPGEQTIAVRVQDEFENQAVEKVVLK